MMTPRTLFGLGLALNFMLWIGLAWVLFLR
jgi:hypothetical protein